MTPDSDWPNSKPANIDPQMVSMTLRLSAGMRIQRLLDARELAAALLRGRLHQRHPELDIRDINLLLLQELQTRGETRAPRL